MKTVLPDAWQKAFEQLVRQLGRDASRGEDEECWYLDVDFTCVSVGELLAPLPGGLNRVGEVCEEMFDDTGEAVEVESTHTIYSSPDELALCDFSDHWQAGLSARIAVYKGADAFAAALARAEETLREEREAAEG